MRSINEKYWKGAIYWVFDAPNEVDPFEKRVNFIKELAETTQWPEFIRPVEMVMCEGNFILKI